MDELFLFVLFSKRRSTDPAAACVVAAAVGVDHSVFLTKDGTVSFPFSK